MEQNRNFRFYQLFLLVVAFALISSCEKDDNDNVVTDVDGNVYHTVKIGTQVWMVENLRTTRYNDNTPIPKVTDGTVWDTLTTPAYCWYNNDSVTYKEPYGALYNGYAVSTYKLAPDGWHVATDAEWTILENYLIENGFNYDGTTTENKIAKALASEIDDWGPTNVPGAAGNSDYPDKRNATGFTAFPSGYRWNYGTFFEFGNSARFWCLPVEVSSMDWYRGINFYESTLNRYYGVKSYGFSVRCVKD
jgi:uncharacterized protein (TIGR02145 family)